MLNLKFRSLTSSTCSSSEGNSPSAEQPDLSVLPPGAQQSVLIRKPRTAHFENNPMNFKMHSGQRFHNGIAHSQTPTDPLLTFSDVVLHRSQMPENDMLSIVWNPFLRAWQTLIFCAGQNLVSYSFSGSPRNFGMTVSSTLSS